MKENRRIALQWVNAISAGDIESICAVTAPNWRMHGGLPGLPAGPDGVRKLFSSFGHISQQWFVQDIICEGNKVVIRAINECLQENFLGIPCNGRLQTFTATFTHTIENGMIQETWRNADDLSRVLQLGARIVPGNDPETKQLVKNIFSETMQSLQKVYQH